MKTETGQSEGVKPHEAAVELDWNSLGGAIPGFDCVQMKDEGAALVQARVAGMTLEEELEYWRKRSAELK